jgi:type I restriction enzyme S subunit
MNLDKTVPAIRFEGFNCEWDKKILGKLVQLENGFAFQSRYFKKNPTEVIVLTPGSVNIGGGFQAGKGQYYDVKQEVLTRYVFEPGDMFITMTDLTPTAQALGFPAIIPRDNNTYLHNQRLGKLVGFKGDLGFLYNLFRTQKKQKEVVSTSSGTTVKHTSPDKFLNRFCYFPKNEEQTQIGNIFQKLDSLINHHQQKHDKLSNIKKSMLEKMFPKQGKTIPRIRFEGYSSEWEENTLGDYTMFRRGSFPQPYGNKEWYGGEGSMPFVQVVDVSKELSLVENTKQKISLKAQLLSVFVPKGSVVVTLQGTVGRVAITQYDSFLDRTILIFQSFTKNTDSSFWAYTIQNKFDLEKKRAPGGTIKTITKDALSSFEVLIPSIEEQTAIGNYFKNLDTLINQHQQQINKLNNIKQACLSKMFV